MTYTRVYTGGHVRGLCGKNGLSSHSLMVPVFPAWLPASTASITLKGLNRKWLCVGCMGDLHRLNDDSGSGFSHTWDMPGLRDLFFFFYLKSQMSRQSARALDGRGRCSSPKSSLPSRMSPAHSPLPTVAHVSPLGKLGHTCQDSPGSIRTSFYCAISLQP